MLKMTTTVFEFEWSMCTRRMLTTTAMMLLMLPIAGSSAEKEAEQAESTISTFAMPNTLKEGRDPFYPSSTRVIAMSHPIIKTKAPGPATLELKGISGTADRPLALINNQTFAEGDEQDVSTPQGRVKVMCLDIDGTTVRVKAQGQTRELMLREGI